MISDILKDQINLFLLNKTLYKGMSAFVYGVEMQENVVIFSMELEGFLLNYDEKYRFMELSLNREELFKLIESPVVWPSGFVDDWKLVFVEYLDDVFSLIEAELKYLEEETK